MGGRARRVTSHLTSPSSSHGVRMELWIVIALLVIALTVTLLALVRQLRVARGLRRLLIRFLNLWKQRHA